MALFFEGKWRVQDQPADSARGELPSLAEKSLWSACAAVIMVVGRFWSAIIIARLLGPSGMGQLAFITWACETVYVLSNRGLSNGLMRYIAELKGGGRQNEIDGLTNWIHRRSFLACLIGCFLLTAVLWWKGGNEQEYSLTLTLSVIGAFAMTYCAAVSTAEYTGRCRFKDLAAINAASALILITAQFLGAKFLGLTGSVVGYALGGLPLSLLFLRALKNNASSPYPTPTLRRQIRRYTSNVWVGHIVSAIVWGRIEILFIATYCNSYEVGLFSAGLTLASLAIYGPVLLRGAFVPHFAQLLGAGDRAGIERVYRAGTRFMALIAFPMGLGGAAIVPVVLPLLYGEEFRPAVPIAVVLTGISFVRFGAVGTSLVYGIGYSRFTAAVEGVAAASSIIACFLVIPSYGAWGAVWVRVGIQTGIIVFQTLYISFGLKYRVPYLDISKILIAALMCAAAASGVLTVLPHTAAIPLAVLVGAGTYAVCILILRVVTLTDLRRMSKGAGFCFPIDAGISPRVQSFLGGVLGDRVK